MPLLEQRYGAEDFDLQRRETCYQGFFSFQRFYFKHKCFDGSWSELIQREVFVRGSATCVLPYDPRSDQVLLIEQFRVAAALDSCSPWLIELVAGINDKGETPEDIARREAQEEAGIDLSHLEFICEYFPSPGACTEKVFLFCGVADLSQAGGVFGLPEENEDILAHVMPFDEAVQLLHSGVINNAPAIMAIQWLQLNRQKMREEWNNEAD